MQGRAGLVRQRRGQATIGLVWLVPPWLARGVPTMPCMLASLLAGCCVGCCTRFLGLYLHGRVGGWAGGWLGGGVWGRGACAAWSAGENGG